MDRTPKKAGAIRLGFRAFAIAIGACFGLAIGGGLVAFTGFFIVALTTG